MHKKTICLISLLTFLIFFYSCKKDNPATPRDTPPTNPGKRNFAEWKIDTLYYTPGGQTSLSSIWGSSATNVYAVGHDGSAGGGTMWHYNGKKWEVVNLVPFYGGKIEGPFVVERIFGFDSTNIYAVGHRVYQTFSDKPPYFLDSSFIIHFDGKSWTEEKLPKRYRSLSSIYGISPNNIWAGENFGMLYHYNGYEWTIDSTAKKVLHDETDVITSFTYNSKYLLATINAYNTDKKGVINITYKIISYVNSEWNVLDTFAIGVTTEEPRWGTRLWSMSDGTILSPASNGIHKFDGKNWSNILPTSSLGNIYGTRDEHLFVMGFYKPLYHFNGRDWFPITIPGNSDWFYSAVWCTEDEVFIIARDNWKTYIIHGK